MHRMFMRLSFWRLLGLLAGAMLLVAACGGTNATPKTISGGTVTFAEGPNAPPNYILPLESGSYFSVTNGSDFSQVMYLPLYWFGNTSSEPVFNAGLSVANAPTFSDNNTKVAITLKHWQWSNGTPITARDVIFWMNLLSAATASNAPAVGTSSAPGPGWGAEVAGGFPFNVVSYQQTGTYSLEMTLNSSYNPTWFLYNELSQIYPMPQASWDRLSATGAIGNYDATAETRVAIAGTTPTQYQPKTPGTGTSGALGVAQFLNLQSQNLSTYSTNPLWQVVDGPFHLDPKVGFTTSGFVEMIPNKNYSGSPKPKISAFEELPFTSDTSEFSQLHSGNLTIGFIPSNDVAQKAALEKTEGYTYEPWNEFGFVYFPYNFTDPTTGPIFKQLYFRQAFQSLVNQAQYIKDFGAGIGAPGIGPVPTYPAGNPDESSVERGGQIYPYNPSRAVSLLRDHGWTVTPGGISVCSKPGTASGDCGAGISAGAKATFRLLYASGSTFLTNEMEAMQSTMKQKAGITLELSTAPFAQVLSVAFGSACSPTKPCSNWDMADWGGGWVYAPDYLPTGGELFGAGASSNAGYYDSAEANSLIQETHTAPTASAETAALFKYEDYIARQLPVVYMPNRPYQLTMVKANLGGFHQGVFDEIYPQYYSFTS